MVDFESIPNTERVDLLRTISDQVSKYYNNSENSEKNQTQIKKKSKSA